MKLIFLFLISCFSFLAYSDEVKIESGTTRPVAGEVFQVYFRVFTNSSDEPSINFSPSNLEVVGKSNQGISTRTIYANGKLTVTREITVAYELVASKPGFASLRDLSIQINGKTIKHPAINYNVLKEPEKTADIFVMADVPKKTLFLGEGVIVRYYLYSKVPVRSIDIKEYPSLNNFLKRFLQEPERTERVSVDGVIYMRTQIYASKLYPEKTGELRIDPLQLTANYAVQRNGDPFGAFGFNNEFRTKSLTSDVVKIQVNPLPEPVPNNFTGLVGNHDFQIQIQKSKLIVNEPLEIKLTVMGNGALENFDAPELLKHSGFEEFEKNGDLKITSADEATKVFDYTYLAKENLNLPSTEILLSHFDPKAERYVSTKLSFPEITVAGKTETSKKGDQAIKSSKSSLNPQEKNKLDKNYYENLINGEYFNFKNLLLIVNLTLAGLVLILSLAFLVKSRDTFKFSLNRGIPTVFKKNDFQLSEFIKWLGPLIQNTGKSPLTIIKEAPLTDETKEYFIGLIVDNDSKEYSFRKTKMNYTYRPTHFRALSRYIESFNGNNTKSSRYF
jgi:hypothetical protein